MLQLVLTLVLLIPFIAGAKHDWSYNNTKQWSRGHRYCGGHSQSPIDLQYNISHYDRRLKQIYLHEQHPHEQAELVNNGHTAQLNLKNRYVLKHVAPESEDYKVEQLHFHWGQANDHINGSEHLHEGQSYPLEMHVVSYSSLYPNIGEAMANTRALAVIGLFFEVTDEPNALLQPLVNASDKVRRQNERTSLNEEFNLIALIGKDRLTRYYRYDGSLTTPPCYESVIWTVLLDPLPISLSQLHAFQYLYDEKAKLMENTYRAVQPLRTRKLFRSFLAKDSQDDLKQRMAMIENNGKDLTNNMQLMMVLISLLIIQF